jgi:hypothetical protein
MNTLLILITILAQPPENAAPAYGTQQKMAPAPLPVPRPEPDEETVFEAHCQSARGRLMTDVWINGAGPYPFLLDAAIKRPVIDPEAAQYLQLPSETAAGTMAVHAEEMRFSDFPANSDTLAVRDLAGFSEKLGVRVAGLLPLWKPGYEVTIDFPRANVTWRPLSAARLRRNDPDTAGMQIGEGHTPVIECLWNGQYIGTAVIDLLRPGMLAVPGNMAAEYALLPEESRMLRVFSRGPGGPRLSRQFRPGAFACAGIEVLQPLCTLREDGDHVRIGLDFLRHFTLTLNFEHGRARFDSSAGRQYQDRPLTGYGIAPDALRNGFWELAVADQSPAWRAGIRPGDRLLNINGLDLVNAPDNRDAGFAEIERMLHGHPGDEIRIAVMPGNIFPIPPDPGIAAGHFILTAEDIY